MTIKEQVLKIVIRKPGLTTAKIAGLVGAPHHSVRRMLNELRTEGWLGRHGANRTWAEKPAEVAEPDVPVPGDEDAASDEQAPEGEDTPQPLGDEDDTAIGAALAQGNEAEQEAAATDAMAEGGHGDGTDPQ